MSNEREKLISDVLKLMKNNGILQQNYEFVDGKMSLEEVEGEMRKKLSKENDSNLRKMIDMMNKYPDKINRVLNVVVEMKKLGVDLKEVMDEDECEEGCSLSKKVTDFMTDACRENVGHSLHILAVNRRLPFKFEVKIDWLTQKEWAEELKGDTDKDDKVH